ncbi:hypothetical protein AHAS_Ahas03G0136100 [Arachis hypogaea]
MSTLQASLLSKPFLSFPFSSSYPSLCRNTFLSFHSLISSHPHLTRLRRNTFFSFHSLTSSHPHLTHLRSRIPYTFNLDNSVTSSSEPQPKPQPQSQLTNSKPNSVEPDAVDASEVPNSNSTEKKIVVLDWNESSLELSSESIVFGSESEGKSANLKKKKKDEDGGGLTVSFLCATSSWSPICRHVTVEATIVEPGQRTYFVPKPLQISFPCLGLFV